MELQVTQPCAQIVELLALRGIGISTEADRHFSQEALGNAIKLQWGQAAEELGCRQDHPVPHFVELREPEINVLFAIDDPVKGEVLQLLGLIDCQLAAISADQLQRGLQKQRLGEKLQQGATRAVWTTGPLACHQ